MNDTSSEKPISNEPFSEQEKREIVHLTREKDTLTSFIDMVKSFKREIDEKPNIQWEELVTSHPEIRQLEGKGYGLLSHTFQRYQEAHKGAIYWEEHLKTDQGDSQLHANLGLEPSSIKSEYISFYSDCCVVRLPNELFIKTYAAALPLAVEEQLSEFIKSKIEGYVSSIILSDNKGNDCKVIVVSEAAHQDTIDHEREHTFFGNYYLREQPTGNDPPEDYKKSIEDQLMKGLEHVSLDELSNSVIGSYDQFLMDIRKRMYYNEIVAVSLAEIGDTDDDDSKIGVVPYFFLQPHPSINSSDVRAISHPYAHIIGQCTDGFLNYVQRSGLEEKEKIQLMFHMQEKLAQFEDQNFRITEWLLELENAVDHETFTAALESIPVERIWAVGHLIGKDPQELRHQLSSFTTDETEDQRGRAFWRLYIRQYPTIQSENIRTTEQIDEDIQKEIDTIDFTNMEQYKSEVLPRIYKATGFPDPAKLINQVNIFCSSLEQNGIEVGESIYILREAVCEPILNRADGNIYNVVFQKVMTKGQHSDVDGKIWYAFSIPTYQYFSKRIIDMIGGPPKLYQEWE